MHRKTKSQLSMFKPENEYDVMKNNWPDYGN